MSRRMRWAGHVARIEMRNAYMISLGKPEGKRPLGIPRSRCVDNIKMDLRERERERERERDGGGMAWINLTQDRD
jgi:hypothetical protein